MSLGVILLGGFAKPLHRLHLILWHAFAAQVAEAEIILSPGVILLGGLAIPLHRLHLILRHAFALVVAKTEFHLGLCVACFCLRLHFPNRFLIGLGLLRGQLNDSDTRRQQKREYQPIDWLGELVFLGHLIPSCFLSLLALTWDLTTKIDQTKTSPG